MNEKQSGALPAGRKEDKTFLFINNDKDESI